jgi:carboxyl-terminal processing protease
VGQAYRIANAFLSTGQAVFTQKGRLGQTSDTYRAENENPDKTPLVVLVNSGTASASEILTGALQDHDRALIVGENTFGKGLVQNPFLLDYGTMLLLTIAKYETPSGRLIQRDYSNGNLYDYYTNGGIGSDDTINPMRGPVSKTDSGRSMYSGGGINPDVVVKPDTITTEKARSQAKLLNPIFAFALDVAYGKVPGFDAFKVDKPIAFEYDIKSNDFAVTDAMFQSFKNYAVSKFKANGAIIDRERDFVERALRTEFVTAAYGTQTSRQVANEIDNQLQKAIELLPQAKQLALQGEKANANAARTRSMNR